MCLPAILLAKRFKVITRKIAPMLVFIGVHGIIQNLTADAKIVQHCRGHSTRSTIRNNALVLAF